MTTAAVILVFSWYLLISIPVKSMAALYRHEAKLETWFIVNVLVTILFVMTGIDNVINGMSFMGVK